MEMMSNLNSKKPQPEGNVDGSVKLKEGSQNRESKSFAMKLAEHITGLKIDDPKIAERLIEDQKIIRAKYGLPSFESVATLPEYERFLRNLADSLGVVIKSKSECGQFFSEHTLASGVHFENEKQVGVNIDKTSEDSYSRSMIILEHELIHALQQKYSPRMPIELREYEAYIAGGNNEVLRNNPELVNMVFSFFIGSSVMHWYSYETNHRGEDVSPSWM